VAAVPRHNLRTLVRSLVAAPGRLPYFVEML
jgi:hypothetical protein